MPEMPDREDGDQHCLPPEELPKSQRLQVSGGLEGWRAGELEGWRAGEPTPDLTHPPASFLPHNGKEILIADVGQELLELAYAGTGTPTLLNRTAKAISACQLTRGLEV